MFAAFTAPSARRRGAVRLAAAALVSGLLAGLLATAGTAAADGTPQGVGGAAATLVGLKTYGAAIVHADGTDEHVSAGLFEMSVDNGGTLQTYGIDIHTPAQNDARYHETAWSGTSLTDNKNAGKICWILQNSYPQVNDLAELAAKSGAMGLTEQDAAVGTQVAIWRYADGAHVDAVDPQAERLADYLQEHASDLPEPAASLVLDPPAVSGHPGERLGPVTVHTNADTVTVTPPADAATTKLKIVDKGGKPVTTAADGNRIYVQVPKASQDGSAELTVQASTTVPVGRAFTSETRSQPQILAGSSESTVSATATATWAKKGAIPALWAEKNCAKGGLDITAVNTGDKAFTFGIMGDEHTVPERSSQTVTVPVQEDQPYDFTIKGPAGFEKWVKGVLDCTTETSVGGLKTQTLGDPSPATVGGTASAPNLAETGTTHAPSLITGTAIALVVIGGATLLLLRRKETETQD